MKEKLLRIRDLIISKSRIVFPVLLIAVVAITVSVALGAKDKENSASDVQGTEPVSGTESQTGTEITASVADAVPDVPLEQNAYPEVNTLIYTYYDALANGDADAIAGICDVVEDMEKIKIQELGNYIEWYPTVEIYTKPGPEENSYVVFAYTKAKFNEFEEQVSGFQAFYVCADENGKLYLKEGDIPEEDLEYIYEMNFQEDVVELYNKATVEYNETMVANTELFEYLATMENDIRTATGMIIAEQVTNETETTPEGGENTGETGENGEGTTEPETPVVTGPVYATATATVNVRKSDSETADKLGKISKGTKVEVLEQLQNGWSKVKADGMEGYIKSEFLQLAESASGVQTIGTVTATTNINVRATASETGEKLGALLGGESLELIENVDGWCKVVYNGQIAYVKSDYVQQQ